MSRVFRGLVLTLALVLVACGGSDDPEPTATSEVSQGQEALPTVPPIDSTPDTTINEEEITILQPTQLATADVSTPESTEEPADSGDEADATTESLEPEDSATSEVATSESDEKPDTDAETEEVATPAATTVDESSTERANDDAGEATSTAAITSVEDATDDATADASEATSAATVTSDEDATGEATVETAESDATAEATERPRTGNETFNHPGDGTGGSGMPGELDSTEDADDAPVASPEASPIAQLTISGCDVPDVPGFLGESNVFILTADVNFRSGPGVDCDPILDEPIGEGQIVLVSGGPVTQADDGTEWVQIEVNGEPGWITNEFLEPSE